MRPGRNASPTDHSSITRSLEQTKSDTHCIKRIHEGHMCIVPQAPQPGTADMGYLLVTLFCPALLPSWQSYAHYILANFRPTCRCRRWHRSSATPQKRCHGRGHWNSCWQQIWVPQSRLIPLMWRQCWTVRPGALAAQTPHVRCSVHVLSFCTRTAGGLRVSDCCKNRMRTSPVQPCNHPASHGGVHEALGMQ